jgi:hypothetical protein
MIWADNKLAEVHTLTNCDNTSLSIYCHTQSVQERLQWTCQNGHLVLCIIHSYMAVYIRLSNWSHIHKTAEVKSASGRGHAWGTQILPTHGLFHVITRSFTQGCCTHFLLHELYPVHNPFNPLSTKIQFFHVHRNWDAF